MRSCRWQLSLPTCHRINEVGGTLGTQRPVLCVELEAGVPESARERIEAELLNLGAHHASAARVQRLLFHPGFPVDIRHNAKIGREKLAAWASKRSEVA